VLSLNLRRRRIAITKTDDAHQSVPTGAFRMMLKSAPCLRRLTPEHQRLRPTRKPKGTMRMQIALQAALLR